MADTSIEWTHRPGTRGRTWNPTNGCEVCSPGCANCYAQRFAGRFSAPGQRYHGLVTIAKNKRAIWTGEGRFENHKLGHPLRWREPSTVFVDSMSDLFFRAFENEQIAAVFGVMAATRRHTYIALTKRAERLPEWFSWAGRLNLDDLQAFAYAALNGDSDPVGVARGTTWPLSNLILGVSVEDRKHGLPRVDHLRRVPAAVRMLSVEPLLEDLGQVDLNGIGWVVIGAESGPGARPFDDDWARSLRDQCASAGVRFFVKQLVIDGKLSKSIDEFPDDLRIREWPL